MVSGPAWLLFFHLLLAFAIEKVFELRPWQGNSTGSSEGSFRQAKQGDGSRGKRNGPTYFSYSFFVFYLFSCARARRLEEAGEDGMEAL